MTKILRVSYENFNFRDLILPTHLLSPILVIYLADSVIYLIYAMIKALRKILNLRTLILPIRQLSSILAVNLTEVAI